jgi:hypothetical protein
MKKSKFHVGQVVMYEGAPYQISSRFIEDEEQYFMLAHQGDKNFDMASPEDLRPLTKKEKQ